MAYRENVYTIPANYVPVVKWNLLRFYGIDSWLNKNRKENTINKVKFVELVSKKIMIISNELSKTFQFYTVSRDKQGVHVVENWTSAPARRWLLQYCNGHMIRQEM